MSESIYSFLNKVLNAFSYDATFVYNGEEYTLPVTIDGNQVAYVGEVAKRIYQFSALKSDIPDGLQLAVNTVFSLSCNEVTRSFKICKDYEGIRLNNDRFNVASSRIRFYGVEI